MTLTYLLTNSLQSVTIPNTEGTGQSQINVAHFYLLGVRSGID
jgi:hypothetical protein